MSERRLVSTGSPFERAAGYSRAVAQGDWCFVSGTTGYDYATMAMPAGALQQAENAFETIGRALREVGFGHVVRVDYVVSHRAFAADLFAVSGRVFGTHRPAAKLIVAGLLEPTMKVEIEVTAFRG